MDPIVISAIIGGIVTMIASAVGAGVQTYQNETNKKIAEQNMQLQKETNETTWQREDTAMQRAFADYKAAGINPLLAIPGHGASSSVVSAPQNNFQYKAPDLGKMVESLNPRDSMLTYFDNKQRKLELEEQRKQLTLLDKKIEAQTTANATADLQKDILEYNYDFYNQNGLPTTATGLPKQLAEGGQLMEKFNNYIENFDAESVPGKVVEWAFTPSVPFAPGAGIFKKAWNFGKQKVSDLKSWWKKREQRRINDYANRYIE